MEGNDLNQILFKNIIFYGDHKVGKTNFLEKLTLNQYNSNYKKTIGID